jgi:outer membrane lipoprotein SlyB
MRNRIAFLLIGALLLSSCATTPAPNATPAAKPGSIKEWMALQSRAKKRAIVGFVIGAALGAVAAGITGGSGEDIAKHALAGGVAGAIAGFGIGKRQDQIHAQRDLAVRQAGYDNSQGYIARVEEVAFDPPQPKPGMTATLYVRYVVIGPNPNEPIKVKMFRGLKYGEDYVFGAGPNEFTVPNGGGVIESTMQVTLPKKAPQGTYSIEALVEDTQGRFPEAVGTGALYLVARARHRGVIPAAS